MKQIYTILIAVLLTASVFLPQLVNAQAPEKMSYQAVVRNSTNQLVTNQSIGMQISILQTTATGTAIYVERHLPLSNANGLVTIEIGTGTIVSGDFATIDWASHIYFIKTESDINGGANYTITGTSQLLSVAYALYAKTAETTANHYVGELYGGGIIYYVYDNGQHGLIASLDDLDGGSGVAWSAIANVEIGITAQSMTNGVSNTAAIVAQDATAGYAATLCNNYTGGGQTDWYLPSNREFYLLANKDILINQILDNDGDATTNGFSSRYWSSTEYSANFAWEYRFNNDHYDDKYKNSTSRVRAIRAF